MPHQILHIKTCFLLLLAGFLLAGCGIVYTDIQFPRAYRSASPIDVQSKSNGSDKVVTGEGCNYSVLFLVAWGNGGYASAIGHALKNEPSGAILYDVHTDIKATVYLLGAYSKVCTVVTGKVVIP